MRRLSSILGLWWVALPVALVAPPAGLAEAHALGGDRTAGPACDASCSCALELTPRMTAWVSRFIPAGADLEPERRLRRLFDILLRRDGLNLKQESGHTPSAAESFDSRRANCAGFAFLFVSLARHLGVPAYFVLTPDAVRTTRRGGARLAERHLAAAYGPVSTPMVVDFGGFTRSPDRRLVAISDETAGAIFCSNRGVEALVAGRTDSALRWLRASVRADHTFSVSWSNLGVALRMKGEADGAEEAYLNALELSPDFAAARNNLLYLSHIRAATSGAGSR